jgi:hypothetical protein
MFWSTHTTASLQARAPIPTAKSGQDPACSRTTTGQSSFERGISLLRSPPPFAHAAGLGQPVTLKDAAPRDSRAACIRYVAGHLAARCELSPPAVCHCPGFRVLRGSLRLNTTNLHRHRHRHLATKTWSSTVRILQTEYGGVYIIIYKIFRDGLVCVFALATRWARFLAHSYTLRRGPFSSLSNDVRFDCLCCCIPLFYFFFFRSLLWTCAYRLVVGFPVSGLCLHGRAFSGLGVGRMGFDTASDGKSRV